MAPPPVSERGHVAGVLEDTRQHHLRIERRADGLTDLPQGAQFLDRAGQLVRARLQLVEQPCVLDGDHRLVGEGLDEVDLLVGEGLDAPSEPP